MRFTTSHKWQLTIENTLCVYMHGSLWKPNQQLWARGHPFEIYIHNFLVDWKKNHTRIGFSFDLKFKMWLWKCFSLSSWSSSIVSQVCTKIIENIVLFSLLTYIERNAVFTRICVSKQTHSARCFYKQSKIKLALS